LKMSVPSSSASAAQNASQFFFFANMALYTVFSALSFVIEPMALLVLTRLWEPPHKEVLLVLYAIRYGSVFLFEMSIVAGQTTITPVKRVLKENFLGMLWILGSRVAYTVASLIFFPNVYNSIAVIALLATTITMVLLDAIIINQKLRMTKATFDKFNKTSDGFSLQVCSSMAGSFDLIGVI